MTDEQRPDAAGSDDRPPRPGPRYGRARGGHLPVGDSFVARLGPAGAEIVAALDDPHELVLPGPPSPDTPISELRFVSLDCETTGQTPHRLVELGAIAFTMAERLASFETLVHSTDRINPYARRLHGINPESLGGAPPADRVVNRFSRFVAGTVLVEHSADAFDTRLIAATLGKPLEADNIDTSRLAAKLWNLKDTIGLEKLCAQLGVKHRRPHHAYADAEATADCFVELVKLGQDELGWQTLGDLLRDGQPPIKILPLNDPGASTSASKRSRSNRSRRPRGQALPPPPDTSPSEGLPN